MGTPEPYTVKAEYKCTTTGEARVQTFSVELTSQLRGDRHIVGQKHTLDGCVNRKCPKGCPGPTEMTVLEIIESKDR